MREGMQQPPSSVTLTLHDGGEAGGHRFGINALATSDDGSRLFTAGRDGTVRTWDASSGQESGPVLDEHTDWVNDIVLLGDRLLASCSSDRTVRLWSLPDDPDQGASCEVIGSHDDYAKALCYAPDSGILASAGFDSRILLWDLRRLGERGRGVSRNEPTELGGPVAASEDDSGHDDSIYALATTADAKFMATGSVDSDVRLWDVRDLRRSIKLSGHTVRKTPVPRGNSRVPRSLHPRGYPCDALHQRRSPSPNLSLLVPNCIGCRSFGSFNARRRTRDQLW